MKRRLAFCTINFLAIVLPASAMSQEVPKAADPANAGHASGNAKASSGKDLPPVRVQYVPETVRSELREQIKQEVLAQARTERWAEPNAIPKWLDSIKWEGDMRLRYQADMFPDGNAPAADYAFESLNDLVVSAGGINNAGAEFGQTRAADLGAVNGLGIATANTTESRRRFRVRARLGMIAKITEQWGVGIRLATGSTTDRVSTNQTLGQDFNKYTLLVDRAFIKYDPDERLSVTGGRIPNPWFSTDMMWDEDLNFEGVAASFKGSYDNDSFRPFLTVGAFPIKEENPPASQGRWMQGVQGGAQWDWSSDTRFKLGLAVYRFARFEGQVEDSSTLALSGTSLLPASPAYGQYEYGRNLRQKGNTLFRTNALGDDGTTSYWGLASRFRPVNLTASIDLAHYDPVHVVVTGDWVRNTAFDRDEISSRTQGRIVMTDGKNYGYHYKVTIGMPKVEQPRDWQVSIGYRFLGSDAVVDAFTDSDFGLGGTNLKGYTLAFQYAVESNTNVGLRLSAADSIDSFTMNPAQRFSADVIQADVNVRF